MAFPHFYPTSGISGSKVARSGLFAFIMIPMPCSSHVAHLHPRRPLCERGFFKRKCTCMFHEAAEELPLSHGLVFSLDAGGVANLANIYEEGRASRAGKACVSEIIRIARD